MSYPRMMRIRQHFDAPRLHDVAGAVREELAKLPLSNQIKPGDSVAITVGSRGIANIALIIKTLVEELKVHGGKPFVVPAMGSHGGGTAEGQRAIVEGYGVTEEYTGAPIKATMEVVQVGSIEDGIPVYFDKCAYESDHVAVVGRVKPHTDFSGEIESGLYKMMLIGLGKHRGAQLYHQAFAHYSFDRIIRSVGQTVMEKCGILLGLAILENPNDETALIRAVAPEEFMEREKELLVLAKKWIPRLPFQQVDLLVIDRIGKDISGTGMDTNVIGRKDYLYPCPEEVFPKVTRIYVRDLTEETHGNATGIGIADYTHTQLVKKTDFPITYINCLTGDNPKAAAIPIHYDTDRKVLDVALRTVGYVRPEDAKVIRIRSTLDLKEIMISEAYKEEMKGRDDLSTIEPPQDMEFDGSGDLLPF
ncbi:MAG: lactate racemase domain-containing protein [Desulfatiglandaceae bacterium]